MRAVKAGMVQFGVLHDGTLSNVRMIRQSDIGRCPFFIFMPDHYREDGTCRCSNESHRAMMVREWDYKAEDFRGIPLVD